MCRRIRCETCGKPSFAGCGMHVEQVLGDVPRAQRCGCQVGQLGQSAEQEPAAKQAESSRVFSWLRGPRR